jgi:hypothetical protein
MIVKNYERIIIGVVSLVGITVLGAFKVVESEAIVGVYSAVIGFMLGHSSGVKAEQLKNNGIKK